MNAPIRSMNDLVAAARAAQIERGVSDQRLEELAGLASGCLSRYIGPNPSKKLGPVSTFPLIGAVGKMLLMVDDPEMVARMSKRWTKRHVRGGAALQMRALQAALQASASSITGDPQEMADLQRKLYMRELGKLGGKKGGSKGGKRRAKAMGKRARQRAASHAARMRWSKQRSLAP